VVIAALSPTVSWILVAAVVVAATCLAIAIVGREAEEDLERAMRRRELDPFDVPIGRSEVAVRTVRRELEPIADPDLDAELEAAYVAELERRLRRHHEIVGVPEGSACDVCAGKLSR
jgi:hypothetical protein